MRRTLPPLAVVLALLSTAAAAPAATPSTGKWVGTEVQLGSDLKFTVSKNGKRIVKISATVLEQCSGSTMSTYTTFAPDSGWKIRKNGRFSGRHKERYGALTAYMTFEGRFTAKRKAKGFLRQETIVAGATCDTYELDWKAKRRG